MSDTILLTGGTGFLGTELAAGIVRGSDSIIYVLVRAEDERDACHRLRAAWHHDRVLYKSIGEQVKPVPGDFVLPGLGLDGDKMLELQESVTLVIHAGAEVGFQKSGQELDSTNYIGTRNMVSFAGRIKSLRRFIYISTAYVSGQRTGIIREDDPVASEFSALYEKSKARAESLVKMSTLPYSICRPGMIVGNSQTGRVRSFNTVYYILRLMLLGRLNVFPVSRETRLNLVPVDYVADSVLKIIGSEDAEGKTFHLTCPSDMSPQAGELADYVRTWARDNLSVSIPKPVFAAAPVMKKAGIIYNRKSSDRKRNTFTNLLTVMPYFFADQEFDRTNTDSICGRYDLDWHDYIDVLLSYACRKNFMRQTGQTVFEQAAVRRASKSYPISYYDVTAEGIRKTTGPEVNRMVENIVDSLLACGIRRGDRVALTGINSVDYLALEQAIGMIGAVSVPIYYTTPAREASMLLDRSGAKWFFIGDKRMMQQAEQLDTGATIVPFSAGQSVSLTEVSPSAGEKGRLNIMRWEDFISRESSGIKVEAPDPDDLATIRYTSGTTGDPKGVMFDYSQLAWMGEVLTNLLPWKDRNRSMRYLSFLPLSHVVEGILASYAPYYVLADVEYYYLNDFGSLTDALPKIRPNVFFSVPRFYEKLWDQIISNKIGQRWLAAPEGPAKRTLASVLRTAVLRKAGLDRCKQLIVGSAPISETLLMNFRSLGIEIYNAYGQTEAPLITINRLGDNVIPTIGTPLPDTKVTVEDDGELIVEGPQVTLGYYGLETDSIRDGVLKTGDLGTIDDSGHITLYGRKKDMIITAYGKNISIPKVEERIKDIPGVSEAVLIGENRPYCTALIWLEGDAGGAGGVGSSGGVGGLDEQIRRMNEGLSHPEQIRKYKVISRPLSIQAEELTPNLKVKRANVEKHFAHEIEEMYS